MLNKRASKKNRFRPIRNKHIEWYHILRSASYHVMYLCHVKLTCRALLFKRLQTVFLASYILLIVPRWGLTVGQTFWRVNLNGNNCKHHCTKARTWKENTDSFGKSWLFNGFFLCFLIYICIVLTAFKATSLVRTITMTCVWAHGVNATCFTVTCILVCVALIQVWRLK